MPLLRRTASCCLDYFFIESALFICDAQKNNSSGDDDDNTDTIFLGGCHINDRGGKSLKVLIVLSLRSKTHNTFPFLSSGEDS